MARICVLTAGHLSTCPRMLKIADAVSAAGLDLRVVSTRSTGWATAADVDVMRTRTWRHEVVDYSAATGNALRIWSGARTRAARAAALACNGRAPLGLAAAAYSRVHRELVEAAAREPADLIYAGTGVALAAAAVAARRLGTMYALDLEDFHSAEQVSDPEKNRLAEMVERRTLSGAQFVTTSSEEMAALYRRKYGVTPAVVHNAFSAVPRVEAPRAHHRLRLYWFSQTIGSGRGLEDVVRAAGLAGLPCELHLRGSADPACVSGLRDLQRKVAPRLSLTVHPPAPPDAMVALAADHDIGLGCEAGVTESQRAALSNKLLTYVAAGLAVICTDTPAQRAFASTLAGGAFVYRPGDVEALAGGLRRWDCDRQALGAARAAAFAAARSRWTWEHESERGRVLALIGSAIAAR